MNVVCRVCGGFHASWWHCPGCVLYPKLPTSLCDGCDIDDVIVNSLVRGDPEGDE